MYSKFLCLLAVLVLSNVLAPSAAAQTGQTEPNDAIVAFENGQNAHESGNLNEALKFYQKAVEIQPDFPEAQFQIGTALQQLGRVDEAIQAYRRAAAQRENWSLPLTKLGALLVQKQQTAENNSAGNPGLEAEALQVLGQAIKLGSDNYPAYTALIDLRLQSNATSIETLRALLSQIQNLTVGKSNLPSEMWVSQARLERRVADLAAARKSIARALQANPKDVAAYLESAELALLDKNYTDALIDARYALSLAPKSFSVKYLLARIFGANEKPDEALKILDSLDPDQKNLVLVKNLKNSLSTAQAPEVVNVTELEKSLASDAKNLTVLSQLCAATRRTEPQKSLVYCRRALELNPTSVSLTTGYGAALVQAKQFDAAIAVLQQVLKVVPSDETARANLATAFYEAKRYAEAISEYQNLLQIKPNATIIYYFMATAHDQLGQYEQAMAAYQKFLAGADANLNQLEIDKVKLRLPALARQIAKGAKGKKPRT